VTPGAQNAVWGTSTYLYDPLGHRKQKSVSGTSSTTQFVLAGDDEIADYNCSAGTCIPWALTVRGAGGLPVVSITPGSGGHTYYHHDVLGSTTAATVPGMNGPAEIYTYSEFGATSSGSLTYRFGGYRYDAETSLYYVHARYYSPALGRFLQTDPAGLSGGTNLYAYVGNDPINLTDPSGLAPDIPASAGLPAPDISNLLGTSSSQINVPPPPPQLTFKTSIGGPGANTWVGYWQVTSASPTGASPTGGPIIQQITVTDASGNQVLNYWEAWQVPQNSQFTTYHAQDLQTGLLQDDTFGHADSGSTVTASAVFYPGQTLPSTFQPGNVVQAGILPSTTTQPSLPTNNASPPVIRTWTAP
jgi:RHS repeat-associated protein